MRTVNYYSFSELTEKEQQSIFEKHPEKFSPEDSFWSEATIDTIKEALKMIGFKDVEVYFSGFWSQGDGAQFNGSYSYRKGALKKVKEEYPKWEELHQLAKQLQELESKDFYSIAFKISQKGHYNHENCTSFDFEDIRHYYGWTSSIFDEGPYKEACKDFMRHIYGMLEEEYETITSWEYVKENKDLFDHIEVEK